MELLQYLNVIRKWIWLIILATTLAAGSSLIASLLAVPVYKTTTTVIVSQITESRNPDPNDIFASQQLVQTYVQLVKREPILKGTVASLRLNQDWQSLREQISATPMQGTQLMEISVLDTSPLRAKAIADEIARQLILQSPTTPSLEDQQRLAFVQSQIPDLEAKIKDGQKRLVFLNQTIAAAVSARQIQDAQQNQVSLQAQINTWQATYAQLLASLQKGSLNYISIVEPAELPTTPVSPNIGLNVLVACAIGLTLSVGAAYLLEYLDDTIGSPDEVRTLINAPILSVIGHIEGDDYPSKLIVARQPRSPITEAYRTLRTNLQFAKLDTPLKTIVITSPGPAEGKSITAANIAVVLAQSGMSVVLVDADLRRPAIHKIFGLKNHTGLTTWLVGQALEGLPAATPILNAAPKTTFIGSVIQTSGVPGVRVVTSGPLPPNPAEVLGSARMKQFLEKVAQTADVVILDSPPCVTVTDAVVLSRLTDGVILVLDHKSTHRQSVRRAKENLNSVEAKMLGTVINRLDPGRDGYYSYYSSYYYYYQSDGNEGKKTSNSRHPVDRLAKWLRLDGGRPAKSGQPDIKSKSKR